MSQCLPPLAVECSPGGRMLSDDDACHPRVQKHPGTCQQLPPQQTTAPTAQRARISSVSGVTSSEFPAQLEFPTLPTARLAEAGYRYPRGDPLMRDAVRRSCFDRR